MIYCDVGRQCSKLPRIYGQLGHLWWSAVDRSMARGNTIAIIRNHTKSDSCISGYSLLWYLQMSMHHHKLSGEKFKGVGRGKNTLIFSCLIKSLFKTSLNRVCNICSSASSLKNKDFTKSWMLSYSVLFYWHHLFCLMIYFNSATLDPHCNSNITLHNNSHF